MIYLFLIYGFAFLALGCALGAHAMYTPRESFARRPLLLVAAFAFLHGAGEWTRMAELIQDRVERSAGPHPIVDLSGLGLLAASFALLLQFGVELLPAQPRTRRRLRLVPGALFTLVTLAVFLGARGIFEEPEAAGTFRAAIRYLLAFPSAMLAAFALPRAGAAQFAGAVQGSREEGARSDLRHAGVAFGVYAVVTGLVVPRAPFFPASVLNQEWLLGVIGVPVEVLRTACAIAIGLLLMKALVIDDLRERAVWEERFRIIFARVPMALAQSDPRTGKVVRANAKMCELTGYPMEEIVGRSFAVWTHPDDRIRNLDEYRRFVKGKSGELYTTEKRYVRKDGAERWVRVTSKLLPSAGEPPLTLATIEDITARKEFENEREQLLVKERAAGERLRVIVETTTTMSEARFDLQRLLGVIPEQVTRQLAEGCILHLVSEDRRSMELVACRHVDPAAEALLREVLATPTRIGEGVSGRAAATARTVVVNDVPPGELQRVAPPRFHEFNARFGTRGLICAPFSVSGKVLGTVTIVRTAAPNERAAVFTDEDRILVEELAARVALAVDGAQLFAREQKVRAEAVRAQEELRQTAEFRERLIGIVSHDLRNPLNAIKLSASILSRVEDLPEKLAKTVLRVGSAVERMRRLIDDLLDFTRGRLGGGIAVEPHPTDLKTMAERVCEELETAHPAHHVDVRARGRLEGDYDEARLAQVVSNLVGNAMEHSAPEHPITVSLSEQDGAAVLEVTNTGDPIPPDLLPHVFDPFRRGDERRTSGGLGLGLFIASEIVKAHGGTIGVASTSEAGTTFRVTLPRRAA